MQKKPALTENNDDNVKLKPCMGMRPGVYLTIIYSFVILLIFFLFLIMPGLRNPRAALIVKTEPMGAAVRVNDIYMGLAGSKIIIPKGTHTITAVMPGFEEVSAVCEIPSRVFGSLFSPKKYKVEFKLETNDPAAAFAHYANEFAQWTFMGEPTSSWQIPLVLSDGAYRTGAYKNDDLQEILKAASRFTSTQAALKDLLRAKTLLDSGGNAPSPAALLSSFNDALLFLSQTPESAYWLSRLLPPEIAGKIEESNWYKNNTVKKITVPNVTIQRRTQIAGISFLEIQSDKNFLISEYPVSPSLFENFLNENPVYREQKKDYYPEEISINPLETHRPDVITGITWYAADAFCKWLTASLPALYARQEARLPSDDEWEAASLVIENMKTAGWEWCDDFYAHLPFIKADKKAIAAVGSPEKLVRGKTSPSMKETGASLQPELSSPYITFRVVITQKE